MRIYISGKITEPLLQNAKDKFQSAQDLLEELGFEAINPLNSQLNLNDDWKKHIVHHIGDILSCNAIYLLDNWMDSPSASIEYDIALRMKIDIWFESCLVPNQNTTLKIQNAIHEATGMTFGEYTTKSRKRDAFFARMIFAYHCRKNKMKLVNIATYVHRDRSSMYHLLKKYDDEAKYNPCFRTLTQRVEELLNR
jgi:hypothetical protein